MTGGCKFKQPVMGTSALNLAWSGKISSEDLEVELSPVILVKNTTNPPLIYKIKLKNKVQSALHGLYAQLGGGFGFTPYLDNFY